MKLILSRKGFDSSSGGSPSPILPDGRLVSLPIPDKRSSIRYCDIQHDELGLGKLVQNLTNGRIGAQAKAHLDPDLAASVYHREKGWKPVLGQTGAAQGHLRSQGISKGDVFVFFGLFRPAELHKGKWRFVPKAPSQHIIWGWMEVEKIVSIDELKSKELKWARYHPHFHGTEDANNTLYISSQSRSGVFSRLEDRLVLTQRQSTKPSLWSVPKWLYPFGNQDQRREPLSFHHKPERWQLDQDHCVLQSVARGQEFVLDVEQYPEAEDWLRDLISIG